MILLVGVSNTYLFSEGISSYSIKPLKKPADMDGWMALPLLFGTGVSCGLTGETVREKNEKSRKTQKSSALSKAIRIRSQRYICTYISAFSLKVFGKERFFILGGFEPRSSRLLAG
jgi:hypothetical protein